MESANTSATLKNFFSQQASSYSGIFSTINSGTSLRFHQRLQNTAALCSLCSGTLLDCAAGSGEITAAVLQNSKITRATLVDISPAMITLTHDRLQKQNLLSRCEIIEADIFRHLTSSSMSYDLILCLGLIAHTGRLPELLKLLHPRLKPETGQLILQSSLLNNPGYRIERLLTRHRYEKQKGYPITDFSLKDIQNAAETANMQISKIVRFGLHIPFADKLLPKTNLFLEKKFSRLSSIIGSEAVIVMKHKD